MCIFGGGTEAASLQSRLSGSRSTAIVPSLKGRRNSSRTRPPSTKRTRSWAIGGRRTYLHKARRPGLSQAPTVVAACNEKPSSVTLSAARISTPGSPKRAIGWYGDGRVEATCQSALAFDVVDVVRISRMLKTATKAPTPSSGDGNAKLVQLTLPRFARPEHQFQTRPSSKEGK